MKKFWNATLIPGLFCIFAGMVLAAVLFFGYQDELMEHAEEFSINANNFYEYFDDNMFISVSREGTRYDEDTTKETYHFAGEDTDNISGVVFGFAVGDVEIRTGNSMEVTVSDMFEGAISSYVEDGIWYITDSLLESGSVHSEYCPDIAVTIPENVTFEQMNIYLAAGRLNADRLNAKEMRLEIDAGSLKVFHLNAENLLTVKNGAGEVVLYDVTAYNLSVEQGVGAIDITGDIRGDNTIKGGIGAINILLKNRPEVNFNYNVSGGLGEVELGDRTIKGSVETYSYDSSKADSFDIICNIGRIKIDVDGN